MNLVELLSRELKDKHFTEFQKARYIYLRCCQIFSFDARWNYFTLFSEDTIKRIESATFDIRYIESPLVICHSFCKSILKPLLDELTTLDSRVVGDNHSTVRLINMRNEWDLDATMGDFARVKIGLLPEGFILKDKQFPFSDFDRELGFTYRDENEYYITEYYNAYDFMHKVGKVIKASDCKYHYTDVAYFYNLMTYLQRQKTHTILDSNGHFVREIHFEENDQDYQISKDGKEYSLHIK